MYFCVEICVKVVKNISILMLFFMSIAIDTVKSQDVIYSQYYANPLYLNPSLVGIKKTDRININYRNEWPSLQKGFVSYAVSYDKNIEDMSGSVGAMVNADVFAGGLLNKYSASLIYAYQTYIFRDFSASVALQASFLQNRINSDKLVFSDQFVVGTDNLVPTLEEIDRYSVSDFDFSAGVTFGYGQDYYFGFAMHHLTQPNLSFIGNESQKLGTRITAHAGAIFDLNPHVRYMTPGAMSISPNIIYTQQYSFKQLNIGSYFNYFPLVVGAWYRHAFDNPDAIIVLLGFEQKKYKIGYSFDYTISDLSIKSGGSHEISFSWLLPKIKKDFNRYTINNPSF